jgi:hypothetical protein
VPVKILRTLTIDQHQIRIDQQPVLEMEKMAAEEVYRSVAMNYPKFFKMDLLCKWAMIGAEYLLKTENGWMYEGIDKTKIAVLLMTKTGCVDVDQKYLVSTQTIPSPALFVYTLPNIMLGEICIRHGFKGEQLSLVSETYVKEELAFWVHDLLQKRGMEACIFGWVNADENEINVALNWTVR